MKRLRKILRYAVVIPIAFILIIAVVVVIFLFRKDAPILKGTVERGIAYKNDLKLDIYIPTRTIYDASPVVFFIHGGAWIEGTKAAVNFNRVNGAVNTLRDHGYTIISPNYSLAGKERSVFPDCILDIYDAIAWMKRNAASFNLDTTNVGLIGESAGGHIAMMIAFPETTLQPEKYKNTSFRYLVDLYGPNDLTGIFNGKAVEKIDATLQKVSKVFGSTFNIKEYVFGFDPSRDSLRAYQLLHNFSPINFLAKHEFPVLIIHGTDDQIVPVDQSILLQSKLDSMGVENEMHLLENVDHIFRNATQAQRDSTQRWISDFVLNSYRSDDGSE